ncbi:TetR/AcrR family transcriptional regulator [Variovorax ginsengisoli]|uniref:AcrR family transcriptional regulator n=1 Tax=Variovorax ginsengisoli TaxID=363844 RepID=A0ABT9SHG5_9BURK|nr:TetR/AcrR family transcriptional regulator [Variovorax ginsengisoli]MDP9902827.1 AcrR family transcriptional regulator [Variovorax ginsengisoli]
MTPRRKPQQSRARHTSGALQEAFVRLLVARDYDAITIREIVDLAGTGLGSFYEYFANKEDLAKVCVHLRSKTLLRALQSCDQNCDGTPLESMACVAVDRLVDIHRESPSHWGVHYLLERRLSGIAAYSKMYERFVREWARLIGAASNRTCACPADTARTCQTILYGLFAHAHLKGLSTARMHVDLDLLRLQSQQALLGYLTLATTPLPLR